MYTCTYTQGCDPHVITHTYVYVYTYLCTYTCNVLHTCMYISVHCSTNICTYMYDKGVHAPHLYLVVLEVADRVLQVQSESYRDYRDCSRCQLQLWTQPAHTHMNSINHTQCVCTYVCTVSICFFLFLFLFSYFTWGPT